MATGFLKKIILEELKKVLKEELPPIGDPLRRAYQKLSPQEQSRVDTIVNTTAGKVDLYTAISKVNPSVLPAIPGTAPTDQQKLANMKKDFQDDQLDWNQLANLGIRAVTEAAKTTPVGKLQAALAAKGHKISHIGNGKLVDGRVGPLTLAAIKEETGKIYTAQQLYNLSQQNPSAMNSLINAVSGETLRQIQGLEKDLQNMKAPEAPDSTPQNPLSPDDPARRLNQSIDDMRKRNKLINPNLDPSFKLEESLLRKELARMLKNL
jgi:hypothetical protein